MREDKSMDNKIAMVAGHVDDILFEIIKSLLEQNATVVVPVRSSDDILVLKKQVAGIDSGKLTTLLTDFPDEYKASMIINTIVEQYGQLDMVVGVFDHPHTSHALSRVRSGDWQQAIEENLTAYFIAGKVCIAAMKKKQHGMFLAISSIASSAKDCSSALTNVMAVSRMEITKQFYEEVKNSGVRFYHLLIDNHAGYCLFNKYVGSKAARALAVGDFAIRLFKGQVKHPEKLFQNLPGFEYNAMSEAN